MVLLFMDLRFANNVRKIPKYQTLKIMKYIIGPINYDQYTQCIAKLQQRKCTSYINDNDDNNQDITYDVTIYPNNAHPTSTYHIRYKFIERENQFILMPFGQGIITDPIKCVYREDIPIYEGGFFGQYPYGKCKFNVTCELNNTFQYTGLTLFGIKTGLCNISDITTCCDFNNGNINEYIEISNIDGYIVNHSKIQDCTDIIGCIKYTESSYLANDIRYNLSMYGNIQTTDNMTFKKINIIGTNIIFCNIVQSMNTLPDFINIQYYIKKYNESRGNNIVDIHNAYVLGNFALRTTHYENTFCYDKLPIYCGIESFYQQNVSECYFFTYFYYIDNLGRLGRPGHKFMFVNVYHGPLKYGEMNGYGKSTLYMLEMDDFCEIIKHIFPINEDFNKHKNEIYQNSMQNNLLQFNNIVDEQILLFIKTLNSYRKIIIYEGNYVNNNMHGNGHYIEYIYYYDTTDSLMHIEHFEMLLNIKGNWTNNILNGQAEYIIGLRDICLKHVRFNSDILPFVPTIEFNRLVNNKYKLSYYGIISKGCFVEGNVTLIDIFNKEEIVISKFDNDGNPIISQNGRVLKNRRIEIVNDDDDDDDT
jgi:hypothetical protein